MLFGVRLDTSALFAHYLAEPGEAPPTNFEMNSPAVMGCGL
ncbi:hypothetical protein SBV1_1570011 [Verrucomicrobia bacterium]|nr:hypothetical protein SBV1_1570011 [Verrucomicrobiota bacterium]